MGRDASVFFVLETRDRKGCDGRFGLAGRNQLGHDIADAGTELETMAAKAEGVMESGELG